MSTEPNVNAGTPGLVDRAKNILLQPRAEWDRISGETANIGALYTGYALPLLVLAAVCGFIGSTMIGASGFGVTIRTPMAMALVIAVFTVVSGLIGIFVMAVVTNALAPNFGSVQDQGQAHKLAVYGSTAGLLGGVFGLLPLLGILGLVAGIYSLVLVWIGLPRLMKTPEDKRVGYFATILVVCIVLGIVINIVLGSVVMMSGGLSSMMPRFGANPPAVSAPSTQGSVTLPGGGSIDLSELEKMGEAYSNGSVTTAASIDPAALQAFLPQSLPGGFTQTSLSSGTGGAMGMNASQAEAVYERGDARMTVTLVHMGAMGGIASMAGAMGVQESRQDADGYSRTNTVDGRVITEEMSRSSNHASYGVMGRGVALTAEGSGVSVDEARAAVEAIGVQRIEAAAAAPG